MNEHDSEPVPGLPAHLPAGEKILWQGRPEWWRLARSAFHLRTVAICTALLMAWSLASDLAEGRATSLAVVSALGLVPFGIVAASVLCLMAWLYARSTLYTVTSRRVVIRFGVALPMTVNVPFRIIGSAAVKLHGDGTADIPLALTGPDRISYLHLWPNVRPWRIGRAEPMLRAVPAGERVAGLLASALTAAMDTQPPAVAALPERRPVEPAVRKTASAAA